jgi:FMN phosphatase YigB (HAD superfamily)
MYRENRRATPGSVETLIRLREHGYYLANVTNGQIEDQAAKAEAIEIRHLVDRIVLLKKLGAPSLILASFELHSRAFLLLPTRHI